MSQLFQKFRRETTRALSKHYLKSTTINFMGLKFRVPLMYGVGAGYHLLTEDWMSRCLNVFIKTREGVIIDIGTNIGLYLLILRALDSQREYYGFEPNPMCNFYTLEMIRLNQFRNARTFPFALSNKREMRTFYSARPGDKMGSLHPWARDDGKRSKVYSFDLFTFSGDEFFDLININDICAIKIDVEGAELEVLQGLKQTIKKYKPYLYCEIWSLPKPEDPNYRMKYDRIAALFTLMDELHYCALGVMPDESLVDINSIEEFSESQSNDYIFACKQYIKQLKKDLS
jgi:FkbM family methyltransferase